MEVHKLLRLSLGEAHALGQGKELILSFLLGDQMLVSGCYAHLIGRDHTREHRRGLIIDCASRGHMVFQVASSIMPRLQGLRRGTHDTGLWRRRGW